ncbi:uncharacterized protein LOC120118929 [Hibiscus syriacus]|uniref:uncharacterized protein LOC120118929 n=1 Tax=Hibiscus syriacus TaxID=106335 RepID=UPI0019223D6C|nr:uncharacterized protein LOC120118929 [Hibiscus syriacus]
MVKPVKQRSKGLFSFRVNPPINLGVKKVSGRTVSFIPREARRLSKDDSLEGYEPVSPQVSCIGQIVIKRKSSVRKPKQASSLLAQVFAEHFKRRVFVGRKRGYESDVLDASKAAPAPSLQQMRQFGKGRSTLSEFDWREYDAEEKGVKRKKR